MKFLKSGAGFTLIELLVVVAIIGVLAGSAFFTLNPAEQLAKSRDAQRKSDFEQMKNALDAYYSDNNRYPGAIDGKINKADWGSAWQPYMQTIPKDPIASQNYLYQASEDGSSYRLYARLEHCPDPQSIPGVNCQQDPYNYSVTSSSLALAIFVTPTPTITPTPTPTLAPKRVFVTSTTYNGNLLANGQAIDSSVTTGLGGGDAICNRRATVSASLGGTWKAWLSTSSVNAKDRIPDAEYRLVDGTTIVANNKADLLDGTIDNRINKDEGSNSAATIVWTGTETSGIVSPNHCNGWTSINTIGWFGSTTEADSRWTRLGIRSCTDNTRLYCFEQ